MIPIPESWLVLAVAYFPALILAVIWHEAGHVIGARLVGVPVAAWGVGLARPHFSYPLAGSRFYFGRPYSSGLTLVVPELFAANRLRRAAVYVSGGPLASLLGMVGGYLLWLYAFRSDVLATWILVSATLVLVTWLPFRIKHGKLSLASDAWQLIDMARGQRKGRLQPSGATLGTLTAVSELLRRVGCRSEADYYQLLAALPRCELSDYRVVGEARDLCQGLPADRFPEAQQVMQFIEAAALVGTDDPRAGEFLDKVHADSGQTPDFEYVLFVLKCYLKLQREEEIGEALQTRLEEARRQNRPYRVCMLEMLAFLADPPQQTAAACEALLARHRRDVTETQRAQLLSRMTELLVEREEHAAAREYYHSAMAAISTVSQTIQVPEVRRQYTLTATLPLQRAMLISTDDLPLFINDVAAARPQVVARFSNLALNLGFACLVLVTAGYVAKSVQGGELPRGMFAIFAAITFGCWLAALWTLIVALIRKEPRLAQGLVGLIVGTVAMLLVVGLKPDRDRPRRHVPAESFEVPGDNSQPSETGLNPTSD